MITNATTAEDRLAKLTKAGREAVYIAALNVSALTNKKFGWKSSWKCEDK